MLKIENCQINMKRSEVKKVNCQDMGECEIL